MMKAGPKKRQYEPVSEWEALVYWGESLAALLEKQEARIEAALGLYETAMEIPPLAEQMYKALKGEA